MRLGTFEQEVAADRWEAPEARALLAASASRSRFGVGAPRPEASCAAMPRSRHTGAQAPAARRVCRERSHCRERSALCEARPETSRPKRCGAASEAGYAPHPPAAAVLLE